MRVKVTQIIYVHLIETYWIQIPIVSKDPIKAYDKKSVSKSRISLVAATFIGTVLFISILSLIRQCALLKRDRCEQEHSTNG